MLLTVVGETVNEANVVSSLWLPPFSGSGDGWWCGGRVGKAKGVGQM